MKELLKERKKLSEEIDWLNDAKWKDDKTSKEKSFEIGKIVKEKKARYNFLNNYIKACNKKETKDEKRRTKTKNSI